MMKHAYLIIAHNEFDVLQKLISTLDDPRNDIYVLIDKKVSIVPNLSSNQSALFVLNDKQRVAIYWGHVSQIQAEYSLFDAASKNGPYQYYHLLSGTHLPLKSQDEIHSFYNKHLGKQVIQPMENSDYQTNFKIRHRHFFLKYFKHSNKHIQKVAQILWRRLLKLQSVLKLSTNKEGTFIKAANWVSLTHDCVDFLMGRKEIVLKKYARTFCGDEFFVPSELASSGFKETCFFYPNLVYSNIEKDSSAIITKDICLKLLQTDFLFARKFGQQEMDSVDEVIKYLKKPA